MICPKCNRRVFGDKEHPLCIPADVSKIYVAHDYYGCDTGCCGHSVTVITPRGEKLSFFHFDHPYNESSKSFIKRMIKDTFNAQRIELDFDLIDYESCELCEHCATYSFCIDAQKEIFIKDKLVEILDLQYRGLDYWQLSKRWKQIHHQDTSQMIYSLFVMISMKDWKE